MLSLKRACADASVSYRRLGLLSGVHWTTIQRHGSKKTWPKGPILEALQRGLEKARQEKSGQDTLAASRV